jgi:hypothetical protein
VRLYSPWQRFLRRVYLKLRAHFFDAGIQALGMCGLFHTYCRTVGWAWRLFRGKIDHSTQAPVSRVPMRSARGEPASHALPGTPFPVVRDGQVHLKVLDGSTCSGAA